MLAETITCGVSGTSRGTAASAKQHHRLYPIPGNTAVRSDFIRMNGFAGRRTRRAGDLVN